MTTIDDGNTRFYRDNAAAYAGRARRTPAVRLDKFLAQLTPGAAVLEVGCGGGQDSAYMLARGFDVTPTDGSPELAAEAERLHVPRTALPDVLTRLLRALKFGGMLHASFKAGNGEGRDDFGRYYNYPSHDWLLRQFEETSWTAIEITEADGSGYDGRPTRWLHVAAEKPEI